MSKMDFFDLNISREVFDIFVSEKADLIALNQHLIKVVAFSDFDRKCVTQFETLLR